MRQPLLVTIGRAVHARARGPAELLEPVVHALFALALAVAREHLEPLMNSHRRERDHKGAFELARETIDRCPKSWGAKPSPV